MKDTITSFIPKIETSTTLEIKLFQEEKLRELMVYLSEHSIFYKKIFQEKNINPSNIKTLEDLTRIPVTTKEMVQEYNQEFICTSANPIIDYVTTSGTLGQPVTVGLTEKDLERLAYNEYISFICANGKPDDIYQLTTTIDRRFMAGLAYFLGVRKLGAGIIRVGSGLPQLQWETINRISPNALIAVPSFILKMIAYAEKHHIDYKNSPVQKAICIGEPIRNSDFSLNTLGKKIKEKWDIQLFSTYASTEMETAFTECEAGTGGHHHPELIIVELLDENNQPVQEGKAGEITITTLGIEGMPLLRFKTGDICHSHYEKCSCGRTTMRLGPIIGRTQQMIKYKGTTLYPPTIFDAIHSMPGIREYIVEVSKNDIETDEVIIHVDAENSNHIFEKEFKKHLKSRIRVTPKITFHKEGSLTPKVFRKDKRKPIRFVDKRKM